MNYWTALEAHKMIEEINLNNADIEIFSRAIDNGIEGAQLLIKGKDGDYRSTTYREDRIGLLMKVLLEENAKLTARLERL